MGRSNRPHVVAPEGQRGGGAFHRSSSMGESVRVGHFISAVSIGETGKGLLPRIKSRVIGSRRRDGAIRFRGRVA
jgi:hypothetical protein